MPVRVREGADRRRGHRRHRRSAARRDPGALPRSDAVLLGAVGGPQWEGAACGPRAGCCACARGSASTPTCGPRATWACPRRCGRGSSAHADILVVRELAGGVYFGEPRGLTRDRGLQHLAPDRRPGAARGPRRLPAGPAPAQARHVGGQGQRPRGLAPLARGGHRGGTRVSGRGAGAPLRRRGELRAARSRRTASTWSLAENLFGDILSDEVGGGRGLDRPPALGLAGRGPRRSSSPSTAPPPTWPAAGSPTPPAPSSPWPCCSSTRSRRPDLARAVEAAVAATLRGSRARPTSAATATTAEFTAAVHRNLAWLRWADAETEQTTPAEWGIG